MTDLSEVLRQMASRHPCPEGHKPVKSPLAELIDRYGVGNIPLSELHRANTISAEEWERMRRKAAMDARKLAAETARASRHDAMADEWAATHVR